MRQRLVEMVAMSGIRDAYVMMIVTRGLRYIRQYAPEECENFCYLMVTPFLWVMDEETQKKGGRSPPVWISCSRRREASKTVTLRGVSSTVVGSLNDVLSAVSGRVPITSNFSSEIRSESTGAGRVWAGALERKPANAATRP